MAALTGRLSRGPRDARARHRGAALVEALVVIPFFILTLAATLFAGSVYATKLRAMKDAKSRAWSYAMANCGEAGDGTIGSASNWNDVRQGFDGNPTAGIPMDGAEAARGAPGMELLEKDVNAASITVEYTTRADAQIGGKEVRPRASERVLCNEAPYDANVVSITRRTWSALTRL